jgi:hypothetical protein
MLTVRKYPFTVDDRVEIAMPAGARILKVECQGETPCVWALVNPDRPLERRRFRIVGTGMEILDDLGRHIATFQHGRFVWHVFENIEPPEPR